MNLPKFLQEVDELAGAMSKEKLAEFVHDIARTLPEAERLFFLDRLSGIQGKKRGKAKACKDNNISREYEEIREKLKEIEEGELCLAGSLNYEYDEWYNSDAEEFLYEDPDGVTDIIVKACDFLHRCIDCEEYGTGYELARILMGLNITVGGEYEEYADEPLPISELEYHGLCKLDYRQLTLDAVYVAYCANKLPDRADAVYKMMENSGTKDITLEMIMQSSQELPEAGAFLKLWIEYLGKLDTVSAERLIMEALELSNDQELLLESARRYCAQHPALYEKYILDNIHKSSAELLETGKEALEAIDIKYVVRSRIALLVSDMALKQGMRQTAERSWLEAFRSDTNVVNYMRMAMECRDFSEISQEAEKIYHGKYSKARENRYAFNPSGELRENMVNEKTVYMLAFLGGELLYVKDHAMRADHALGWSLTFMKCGLAAFLLFLLNGDSLQSGCSEMCRKIVGEVDFDRNEYQKGTGKTIEDNSQDWFWKCFCRWKGTISVSEEEKEKYLLWIEKLVLERVKGIMEGNHRNYYGECAGYIAALGEVEESRGMLNGKQAVMLEYKTLYSRRSAFHSELRAFGMKDQKKR